MSSFSNNFGPSSTELFSMGNNPQNYSEKKTCLLCNIEFCGNVSNTPEVKRLFCKIFKVLPPTLHSANDSYNENMFGSFCQFCSSNVAELCHLERQMSHLKSRMDQMKIKIANCVVNSFSITACNQNGYFVKRQIYEQWFEKCHQIPTNIWKSTPNPMSTSTVQIAETPESADGSTYGIRIVPVQKLICNDAFVENDDDCGSIAGNFPLSPFQEENSNDSVEIVYYPRQPVLPLPCVIKKVKRKSSKMKKKHSKKRKKSDKDREERKMKKLEKLKKKVLGTPRSESNKLLDMDNDNDDRGPASPLSVGDSNPPHLSPVHPDDYPESVEISSWEIPPQISKMLPFPVEKENSKSSETELKKGAKPGRKRKRPIENVSTENKKNPFGFGPPKMDPHRFICQFCQKRFTQKCNFDAHIRTHTGEKPFKCNICGRRFASQGNKISHEANHDKSCYEMEPKYACDQCDKKYHIRTALTCHKYRVHNPNNAPCEFCGVTVVDLKEHLERLHTICEKRPSKCATCHFTFADDIYLQMHQSVHTSVELLYQCSICRRGLKKRNKLNQHLKQVHKITDCASATKVASASECVEAPKKVAQEEKDKDCKEDEKRPVGRPKGLTVNRSRIPRTYSKEPKTFMCEICGKISKQSYIHWVHLRTHSGEKPYKCRYCDKRFNDAGNRLKHEVIHDSTRLDGEPKIQCKQCDKKFHLRSRLYAHTKRHHTDFFKRYLSKSKAVECDICGVPLRRKSLGGHKKRFHSGNPKHKFQCQICLEACVSDYTLKLHGYKHQKDIECEDFKCILCPPLVHEVFSKEEMIPHYKQSHSKIKEHDIIFRKTYKCPDCPRPQYYFLLKSILNHIGTVHERVKDRKKRIRHDKIGKRAKIEPDTSSESESENCDRNIKDPFSNIKCESFARSSKRILRKSSRVERRTETSAKKSIKSEKVPPQLKELRIVLRKIDEGYSDNMIEIKEEIVYM